MIGNIFSKAVSTLHMRCEDSHKYTEKQEGDGFVPSCDILAFNWTDPEKSWKPVRYTGNTMMISNRYHLHKGLGCYSCFNQLGFTTLNFSHFWNIMPSTLVASS